MTLSDCSYWEYQISLALDGEPGPEANEELARHLGECPHCRSMQDFLGQSAQALRSLPDLADPDLLAGLRHDIIQKTYRARRKWRGRLLWPAAALLAAFIGANLWLGPLWQRPTLVAAVVAPGNRLALTFNQPMDGTSWPGTVAKTGITAGPLYAPGAGTPLTGAHPPVNGTTKSLAGPEYTPQAAPAAPVKHSATFAPNLSRPAQTFAAVAHPAAAPPYTVTRQGNTIIISFAGPLPPGPVRILVPATVRDRWGRQLGRAYLVVVDHGTITVRSP